jgi:hypothetical protein
MTISIGALFLASAAPSDPGQLGSDRYPTPPDRPRNFSWPAGLAKAIASGPYVDGFHYENPGYVVEMIDTFFYDGDTEALNRFLARLTSVKEMEVLITFSKREGRVDPLVRPGTAIAGEALALTHDSLDGRACTWLVGVTPKEWAQQHGSGITRAHVVVFLGSTKLDVEALRLPKWAH